ncbi:agouti-signaling protein 2b isoform X1 [Trachinotus anak]|uniref:agouti-signaling protein 2b isoform X1 n=1 Tax=Trachinotus anak TaxID=443729 RepID=UPI0039F1A2AA
MGKITGKHLLCFFLLAFPLSWAEDTKKDVRKTDNETANSSVNKTKDVRKTDSDTVWSQANTRPLFARRKILPSQDGHTSKHRSDLMTPAHRCSRLMESCSSRVPCCDPCASCRCRLFNTICHCWKMNHLCLRKT